MKGRNLLLLAAALGVLVLVATLFESSRRRATIASEDLIFPGLALERVDKIEIIEKAKTTVLEKRGERWMVATEGGHPAEPAMVDRILERLPRFYADQVVSTNPENHPLFMVDTSGVEVRVHQDGKMIGNVIVGKPGADFLSTYIRVVGSDRVLQVPEELPSVFQGHKTWRARTIFDFDHVNIEKFEYGSPSLGRCVAEKDAEGNWSMLEPSPVKVDRTKISMAIGSFSRLKAVDFGDDVDEVAAGLATDTTWIRATLADGSVHAIRIGATAQPGRRYVRKEGSDMILILPQGGVATMMQPPGLLAAPILHP